MRRVGDDETEERAQRYLAALAEAGIEADVREASDGKYALYVLDEDRLPQAEELYLAFVAAAPDDPRFRAKAPVAEPQKVAAPAEPAPAAKSGRHRHVNMSRSRNMALSQAFNAVPLTFSTIVLCVALTLVSWSQAREAQEFSLYLVYFGDLILQGQVWRLITPIFLHADFLHLLFNMMWLYQLGGAIETLEGKRYLVIQTLIFAIIVDTAQYCVSGPGFLGFSGVGYAQFGYVWMMTKYQPGTRYFIATSTVYYMIGWAVFCLTGALGPVANTEHFVGLGIGVAWGYLRSGHLKSMRRRAKYRSKL